MPRYVIDTNVPIVANGKDQSLSVDCRLASVELLKKAVNSGIIFLDSAGEIQEEYQRHLNPRGQPGVGDMFYREVLNSHPDKVKRVDVRKRADEEHEDVPQAIIDAGFDPSDRKFVAVARKARAKVYNAVDTDWVEKRAVIEASGIKIEFLCGCDPARWRPTDCVNVKGLT